MSKMIKRIMAMGIVCSMLFGMIAQESMANETSGQTEVTNVVDGLEETELLVEDTDESCYVVLYDVEVTSELIDNDTITITLTNTSEFVITDWIVAYESSYDIISIENAELVMNSQVKEFKALDENTVLEAGDFVTTNLEIVGTYNNSTEYRVYGLCDEISEDFAVIDYINYNASTGETSLITYDSEDISEEMQLTYTQGLDVISMDMEPLTDSIVPESIIPDENCTCPNNCICIRVVCQCRNESECDCIFNCPCDSRFQISNVNVAPYNKIALVVSRFRVGTQIVEAVGTGFMISSRHMLTAGHMIYDELFGTAVSIDVYFGAKGYTYSSKITASDWSCCPTYPSNSDPQYDWGHIELSTSPGRGYFSLSTSVTTSHTLTVCGYPGDKSVYDIDASIGGYLYYMYGMSGTAEYVFTTSLYYNIDTYKGQSGSPIYNSSNQVVGIHNTNSYAGEFNKGCKISPTLLNTFQNAGWCS